MINKIYPTFAATLAAFSTAIHLRDGGSGSDIDQRNQATNKNLTDTLTSEPAIDCDSVHEYDGEIYDICALAKALGTIQNPELAAELEQEEIRNDPTMSREYADKKRAVNELQVDDKLLQLELNEFADSWMRGTYYYEGEVDDSGVPTGNGHAVNPDGNEGYGTLYVGEWFEGKFHGEGELIYKQNNRWVIFHGLWMNGEMFESIRFDD